MGGHRTARLRLAGTVAVLACLGAVGCADSSSTTTTGAAAPAVAPTTTAAAPAPDPTTSLQVDAPQDQQIVHRSRITVSGRTDDGAEVTVDGKAVDVAAGRFRTTRKVSLGDSTVVVKATAPGAAQTTQTLAVTRERSAAERQALERRRDQRRAAAKRRRAERKARARASFIASAGAVPYKALQKDAGAHKGKHVVFRGQVFQIQQDGDLGGIMLLSVTDEGYGFWDDNIWVDYDHAIGANEDDIVTVYGTITGSKSYETQAGGETYVPRMHARYIVSG